MGGRQTRGCKQHRGGYGSHNLSRHIQLHVGFSRHLRCGNRSKFPAAHILTRHRDIVVGCRFALPECCNAPMRQVIGTILKIDNTVAIVGAVQLTKIKARPADDRGRRALTAQKSRISSPRFCLPSQWQDCGRDPSLPDQKQARSKKRETSLGLLGASGMTRMASALAGQSDAGCGYGLPPGSPAATLGRTINRRRTGNRLTSKTCEIRPQTPVGANSMRMMASPPNSIRYQEPSAAR